MTIEIHVLDRDTHTHVAGETIEEDVRNSTNIFHIQI